MKRAAHVAVGFVLVTTLLFAETVTTNGFTWTYTVSGGQATLYNGGARAISPAPPSLTFLSLPSSLGGVPLTAVGAYALINCTGLVGVSIPEGVTRLDTGVFFGCSNLSALQIPACVTAIGEHAFFGTAWLNNQPPGVLYAGRVAYQHKGACPASIAFLSNTCGIAAGAFRSSAALESVDLPDGLVEIGESAFQNCAALTSVTIPDSTVSIRSSAFSGCTSLSTVSLGKGLATLGNAAFYNASNLTAVSYQATNCANMGGPNQTFFRAGHGGTGVTVIVGNAVRRIPAALFYSSYTAADNANLSAVLFSSSDCATEIGYYAFYLNPYLDTVDFGNSVSLVENQAFYGCTSLADVTLPDRVTSIGDLAFENCLSVTNICIGNGVRSVGGRAFYNCERLRTLTIGEGVATVSGHAFYNATDLADLVFNATNCAALATANNVFYRAGHGRPDGLRVTIGNAVSQLPANLFDSHATPSFNARIKALTFEPSSSCSIIGARAFYYCTALESLTLPSSVTSLGSASFYGAVNMTSLVFNAANCVLPGNNNAVFYQAGVSSPSGLALVIGNTVRHIPDNLFYASNTGASNPKVKQLSFQSPSACTAIGTQAFFNNPYLPSVSLPGGITSIGSNAFYNCTGITDLVIPETVSSIGYAAFYDLVQLGSLAFNASDCAVPGAANNIFLYAGYNRPAGLSVTIGRQVQRIPDHLFYSSSTATQNAKITELVFEAPSACSAIGENAFRLSPSLAAVALPDGVLSVGNNAFAGCGSLVAATLSGSVASIGSAAFSGCGLLTSLAIPEGVTSIESSMCSDCGSLTSVTFPDGITSIGSYAFSRCGALTDVTVPGSATSVLSYAFYSCTGLTSAVFCEGVASIGSFAFNACSALSSLAIPDSVTTIGQSAFDGTAWYNKHPDGPVYAGRVFYRWKGACPAAVALDPGTASVSDSAFKNCPTLTDITIPDGVRSIGNQAFYGCSGLSTVHLPDSVSAIGYQAFYQCTGLTAINIPSGVAKIGDSAFSGCGGLTSISLPASVASVGSYAFSSCTGLVSAALSEGVASLGAGAFSGCSSLLAIDIPDSVTAIRNSTFSGCSALTEAVIGKGVSSVTNHAFSNTSSLTSLVFHATNCAAAAMPNYAFYRSGHGGSGISVCIGREARQIPGGLFYSSATAADNAKIKEVLFASPSLCSSVGANAFYNNPYVSEVGLGSSLALIGNAAFYACSNLTAIAFPDALNTLGNSSFYGCFRLKSVTLPANLTSIGDSAFYGCYGLPQLVIPDRVATIGESAFRSCRGLASLTLGHGLTSIGNYAFNWTTNVCSIVFLATNCASLWQGNNAFSLAGYGRPEGVAVTIGRSVSRIPDNLFFSSDNGNNNAKITALAFEPPSVCAALGSYAFFRNPHLSSISLPDSVATLDHYVFSSCSALPSIMLPDSVTTLGWGVFEGCGGLTNVIVGSGVSSIGSWAFASCGALTSVTFEGNVPAVGSSVYASTPESLTNYIYPGTAGWGATFGDRPVAFVAAFRAWLDSQYPGLSEQDHAAQAQSIGANGRKVWESYVAGLEPTDPDSRFQAFITVGNDGRTRITWSPDLGSERVYRVEGKPTLEAAAWGPADSASRFFRVQVRLP